MSILGGDTLSVPYLMTIMRGEDTSALEYVLHFFQGQHILKVVPWNASGDGEWALHITLEGLGKPREQAYIPISWDKKTAPTVAEAIVIYNKTKVIYAE